MPVRPPVRLRDLARPLAALVALHVALMLAWTVLLPTFRGADEHVHHDFLRHLTETWQYPDYDELRVHQRTLVAERDSPAYRAHHPPALEEEAIPRGERASWSELGPDVRDGPINQLAQHPPLYYVPTAAALRLVDGDGSAPLDLVVWQLRLLNVVALGAMPLLAADIARRLTSSVPVVLSAGAGVLAVPQLTHLGGTLSNDPMMVALSSLALAGVTRMLTGDRRVSTAALTGLAAGLALLTKGFAVPLVPAVALACLLPVWWERRRPAAPLGRAALVAGLAMVVGGWWWVRNVVVHGNVQPGVGLRPRVEGIEPDVVRFAGNFSERLIDSFWGNVGWREAQLPLPLSIVLTVGLVAAVAVACWEDRRRLVLVVPTAVAGVMVLAAGWGAYRKTGVSYATQGRYLFASIAVLVALAAVGAAKVGGPWIRRHQPVLVLAAGLVLQAGMLVIAGRRYWGGDGLERIEALVAFSPLPAAATAALLVLPALAAGGAVAAVLGQRPATAPTGLRPSTGVRQEEPAAPSTDA